MAARWNTLIAVSIAAFMLLLDITVVNVALPDIQREFGASFDDLRWVIDAYALTLAATMLVSGSLGTGTDGGWSSPGDSRCSASPRCCARSPGIRSRSTS